MAGLVCEFLVLSAILSVAQSSQIKATITPSTPFAFNGRKLAMNCTLQGDVASNVSSVDMYFSWPDWELAEEPSTHVIDDRTIGLAIKGVYLNMSSSRISCNLRNDTLDEVSIVVDLESRGVTSQTMTHLLLTTFEEVPRFPSDPPKCVVYNRQKMTCTWEMDENDNTTVLLAYSRSYNGRGWSECPKYGYRSCLWDSSLDPFFEASYSILLYKVENGRMLYETPKTYDSRLIVKPDPIKELQYTNVTSNHVEMTWKAPYTTKPIQYRVAYESRFSSISIRNTTETSILLSNLIPNTQYTITIDCIPIVKQVATGFWSDKNTTEVTTETDVPGDSPSVTAGGFSVFEPSTSHRSVKLFFQPVDDFHSHGTIEGYRVRYSAGNSAAELKTDDGLKTNVVLLLEMESTYSVSVDARTFVGYNESLVPQTVVISRQSELPSFPKNFVVQTNDEDTYILNWTSVDQASSYTLYWCIGTIRLFECTKPLDWKILPPNQTSEVLQLVGRPSFAISVENVTNSGETVSSGMLIANCTFSKNKELKPPEPVSMTLTNKNAVTVFLSRPDRSNSIVRCTEMAYPPYYLISYCHKSHCKETDKTVMVESYEDFLLIDGLEEGVTYEFRIQSWSENGSASVAALIGNMTMTEGEEKGFSIALVAAVVVVGVALCALPIVVKLVGWLKKEWHIEVKTPPKYVAGNQATAGELSSYSNFPSSELHGDGHSNFLRSDLHVNGQVQTTVCKYGNNRNHTSFFSSSFIQHGEDTFLLSKHNSAYHSSASSSQLSPVPSVLSSSASSQSSSDRRRDSGISASISGYNIVGDQSFGNPSVAPGGSGTGVPQDDDAFVAE